jgi:large subunit ribosomal protein L31
MKSNIHPNWHSQAQVTCSCGNSFVTGSTLEKIEVDICNKCHPFFTGEMKFVDRQGRVDKFKQKVEQAQAKQKQNQLKQQQKQQSQAQQSEEENLTYQEILREKQSQLRQDKNKTTDKK